MTKIKSKTLKVAVAGNPNAGKTTIFNNLTGARQRVGNYSGVTVECMEGTLRRGGLDLRVIDLPGTYSLTAFSEEELVARDYLLHESPDMVINVVDAANLERNLYLTTELLELGLPLIVVLNMSDTAREKGLTIDLAQLADRLGAPVVAAVGHRNQGTEELIETIAKIAVQQADLPRPAGVCRQSGPGVVSLAGVETGGDGALVGFGDQAEGFIKEIIDYLPESSHCRWLAVKLLEEDPEAIKEITDPETRSAVAAVAARFADEAKEASDTLMPAMRYKFIEELMELACRLTPRTGQTRTDRVDRVVLHSVWGVPIFLLMMFVVFTATFTLGNPLMYLIESGFDWMGRTIAGFWPVGAVSPLKSLLVDGVIGGVGGVMIFLPNIVLLFLAIAVLEGTGYMARAAIVMDRFMSKVGLHGKSFIPLLIGFGCTVPAIMATRTLETRRDRLITMMVLPLMSCGARLPIYALMIPAFFPVQWQGPVLWSVYVAGIVLALVLARLLRATVFRGETTPLLMELPPYRMPTPQNLLVQMWTRAWLYVQKAGTVILGAAVILWFLTFFPKPPADYPVSVEVLAAAETVTDDTQTDPLVFSAIQDEGLRQSVELSYSVAGRAGRLLEPVLEPLGFDWRIATALLGAIAAKEVFVAQLGIVFAVEEADEASEDLRSQLRRLYSPLVGLCIMLFALISTPCIATFAITRQEAGSIWWAIAQSWGLTVLAWIVTFGVHQAGLLLGLGVLSGGAT
ncbi:MAG: ferrous iron transport protein B [Gemmatimonadales bacterium]|nr:ferrous iron transport protein B [Gemmatimonadales bacterium]